MDLRTFGKKEIEVRVGGSWRRFDKVAFCGIKSGGFKKLRKRLGIEEEERGRRKEREREAAEEKSVGIGTKKSEENM